MIIIRQKEFSAPRNNAELFKSHIMVVAGELVKVAEFQRFCATDNINHWLNGMINNRELKETRDFSPTLFFIPAVDTNHISASVVSRVGANVMKDYGPSFGEKFIRDAVEYAFHGGAEQGKYDHFEDRVKRNSNLYKNLALLFKYIALCINGQLDIQNRDYYLNSYEIERATVSDLAKGIKREDVTTIIARCVCQYRIFNNYPIDSVLASYAERSINGDSYDPTW